MIKNMENRIFLFLEEKLKGKGVHLFRGFLPEQKHEDREKGQKTHDYFPFVILRVTNFEQTRTGQDSYDVPISFELWIGTKATKEEEYIDNLSLGDFLRQELLRESTKEGSFAINQAKGVTVDFYSDQLDPYFYSRCQFTAFGIPEVSVVSKNKMDELLGRRSN